jgi:calpain
METAKSGGESGATSENYLSNQSEHTSIVYLFSDRNWRAIPQNHRQSLGLTFEDDGEFYMSFRDFLKYFGELEICHLTPDSGEDNDAGRRFEVFLFNGEWRRGRTSGGCGNDGPGTYSTNPQFFVNLSDPDPYDDETTCPVIVSLMQRQKQRKTEHAIGFKMYQCDLGMKKLDETYIKRNNSVRTVKLFSVGRCLLDPHFKAQPH